MNAAEQRDVRGDRHDGHALKPRGLVHAIAKNVGDVHHPHRVISRHLA